MMDHFITLGDLLKLGSFLLDLTRVILYIYYNQKLVKSITIKRKRNNRPRIQTVAVILRLSAVGADRLLVCSLSTFIIHHFRRNVKWFFPRSFKMRMPQGNAQKICVKL